MYIQEMQQICPAPTPLQPGPAPLQHDQTPLQHDHPPLQHHHSTRAANIPNNTVHPRQQPWVLFLATEAITAALRKEGGCMWVGGGVPMYTSSSSSSQCREGRVQQQHQALQQHTARACMLVPLGVQHTHTHTLTLQRLPRTHAHTHTARRDKIVREIGSTTLL